MGRQAFMTRLALGRSPFEDLTTFPAEEELRKAESEAKAATKSGIYVPSSAGYVQRYDCRGHPQNLASDYLREQSRRAQNRVSSLFHGYQYNTGHAVRSSKNSNKVLPIDPAKIQSVRVENRIGLRVMMTDQAFSLISCICMVGVRQRLQTFHVYVGAGLWEVLKSEWIHFGLGKMLFAGFPASFLNRLGFLVSHIASYYCDILPQLEFGPFSFRKHRAFVKFFSAKSKLITQEIVFMLLTPLEIHATRQRLDLVPMWPFLPPLMAFIPFTSESLFQHLCPSAPLRFSSCAQHIKSLFLSPFVLWYVMSYCKRQANWIIRYYVQFLFPRPENPDLYSIKGAELDGYALEDIPGIDRAIYGWPSLIGEVKRDSLAFIRRLQFRFNRWRNMRERREVRIGRKNLTESVDEPRQFVDTSPMNTTTRYVGAEIPSSGYKRLTRSFQKNTSELFRTSNHRVTILNGSLASSISRHISWNLSDLLFIPLESLLLRSIAHGFLSSPRASCPASGAQSSHQILPLGNWFGLGLRSGGWRGVVRYAGKIGLWWGFEVAARYLAWQLNAGIVWWLAPWVMLSDKSGQDGNSGRENV